MTFRQEREDDEDVISIHMTMLGEPYRDQGDQQGCPNQEGGPNLIQFESPRWRPKSISSAPRNPGAVPGKINTVVMPYSSSFAFRTQVESKEREHMFLVSTNLLQDSIGKDRVYFN